MNLTKKQYIILIFLLLLIIITISIFLFNTIIKVSAIPPPNGSSIPIVKELNIAAVGDIMLGRKMPERIGTSYDSPFAELKELFAKSDIRFANLECVLSDYSVPIAGKPKGFCLKGTPNMINVPKSVNFSILSLANNHTYDYDSKGLTDTLDILKKNNIPYIGAGKNLDEARELKIIEFEGTKVGFLAYTDMAYVYFDDSSQKPVATNTKCGVAPTKEEYILEDISNAKNKCDLLFVSMHWGIEYQHVPTESQQKLAKKIIDSGADGILGHHPHNLQGIEIYNNKPIIYSMGNFFFDQNAYTNNDSAMFNLQFVENKFKQVEIIPLRIEEKKKTIIAQGEAQNIIIEHMKKNSNILGTTLEVENGNLYYKVK